MTGRLPDAPDRGVPGLLPARDLAAVPRADLRPQAPAVAGRARKPAPAPEDRGVGARLPHRRRHPRGRPPSDRSTRPPRRGSTRRTSTCRPTASRSRRGRCGRRVTLAWPRQQPGGTHVPPTRSSATATDQAICVPVTHAASNCSYTGTRSPPSAATATSWTDHPPPGTWAYRVALSATSLGPQAASDYTLLSRPVTVTVRP